MVANPEINRLSPEAYFEWEEQQPERYEYFDGVAYAMAGGILAHGRVKLKITSLLSQVRQKKLSCI